MKVSMAESSVGREVRGPKVPWAKRNVGQSSMSRKFHMLKIPWTKKFGYLPRFYTIALKINIKNFKNYSSYWKDTSDNL